MYIKAEDKWKVAFYTNRRLFKLSGDVLWYVKQSCCFLDYDKQYFSESYCVI